MKTANDDKNRVVIFDTTLRDGEQCPGATMTTPEKLEVARQLARLKVDIIEAGFPIASPGDFEAVNLIARTIKGPRIAGLARCVEKDIVRCAEAVAPAGARGRIHVFLATSAIHRQFKLRKAKHEIIKQAVFGVKLARQYVADVQFSPEDASRTEPDFLAEVCQAVIEAGATTVNIPDTVGYAVPWEFGPLIGYLKEHVRNIDDAVIHVHCHNDLGLAVANSLSAVQHGARGVECTINGIGERAGNCSLEEVVMALRTRSDAAPGVWTGVDAREIMRTSRLVSRMTGFVVQRNKAIVGANAFAHESGIHQDGMLKHRKTYEIMRPEDIGLTGTELVLGKHSGRHALGTHLAKMGFELDEAQLEQVYLKFKELADRKKTVFDDDLMSLMQQQVADAPQVYELEYLRAASGTGAVATSTVRLKKGGKASTDAAIGDGPVDATFKVIDRITGISGTLEDYALQAVTKGEDAVGEVSVRVRYGDQVVSAKGSSTDIIEASAKAYLNALNRYLFLKRGARKGKAKAAKA